MAEPAKSYLRITWFFFLGLGYTGVPIMLSLLLSGAGHGWTSAIACWPGIFVVPFLGVALASDKASVRRIILWGVVGAMIAIDVLILRATAEEGWNYASYAFERVPIITLLWGITWGGWQVLAVITLFRAYRLRR